MKVRNVVVVALLLVAAGFVFYRLGTSRPPESGGSAGGPPALRAASLLQLEGPLQSYARQVQAGIDAAVAEIAEQHKDRVQIVYKSFEAPERAQEQMQTAVADGMRFAIEVFGTGPALKTIDVMTREKVVTISGVNTGDELSGASPYFFRIVPGDGEAIDALLTWAAELGVTKVGVIAVSTDWGKGIGSMVEKYGPMHKIEVSRQNVDAAASALDPVIDKLLEGGVNGVVLGINPDQAGNAVRALAKKKTWKGVVLGTDNLTAGEFTKAAAADAQGVRYVLPPEGRETTARAAVVRRLRARLNLPESEAPHPFTLYGYDAAWLMYRAMKASGSDPDKAVAFLKSYDGEGATGRIRFNPKGDLVLEGAFRRMQFQRQGGALTSVATK